MTVMSKITDRHLSKQACIYIRQSTLAQVRFNQESTDRQYNLVDKALSLGWNQEQIRVLDRDLGQSGTAATTRMDFKTLVSDVAMGQVGAIFALEASRLARSNQAALMSERQQPDHSSTGSAWRLFGGQHIPGAAVRLARKQLVAIDQIQQCHRLAAQCVDHVAIIDHIATAPIAGRRPRPS